MQLVLYGAIVLNETTVVLYATTFLASLSRTKLKNTVESVLWRSSINFKLKPLKSKPIQHDLG